MVVTGLTSAAGKELNGRNGIVRGTDAKTGRLIVCLDHSDPPELWKKLKPRNVVNPRIESPPLDLLMAREDPLVAVANRRRSGPKARKTIEKKGDGRRKRREKKVRAKKTKKSERRAGGRRRGDRYRADSSGPLRTFVADAAVFFFAFVAALLLFFTKESA